MVDKKKGLMYGICIGDTLGARYEFYDRTKVSSMLTNDFKNNHLPVLGGGFFKIAVGQLTDDSEMSIELLGVLAERGKYNQKAAAKAYIKWYKTEPIDIGQTIEKAINSFTSGISKNKSDMLLNAQRYNSTSLSNGTLMRIAPIALLHNKYSLKHLKSFVKKDCELTHPHNLVIEVSWLFTYATIMALSGKDKNIIFETLLKECKIPNVYLLLLAAIRRPEPTILDGSEIVNDNPKYQGYLGIAFQNAIYELMNGKSFEESLVNVIRRGGDTDTNCAVVGALLGSYYGFESIPSDWVQAVENCSVERNSLYNTKLINDYLSKLK